VDAVFYKADDLAGLIWDAADTHDHPLLAYQTDHDFRACVLSFRWRSTGVLPLDAVNGPTLTIEGRDAAGVNRAWYVRLWNYATGTPTDADVRIDFAALDGGFLLPSQAVPVWAGDVDRMFVSLVAPGYSGADGALPAPVEAHVELSGIACDGAGSVLAVNEATVPAHTLRMATGYDDAYDQTPERLLRTVLHLGYRGVINHYIGMSHFFRLAIGGDAGSGFTVTTAGGALNVAARAWHADFLGRAKALGLDVILSQSFELFDAHCPQGWKQRDASGAPALIGWVPPSTLLSPASDDALSFLRTVARAFAGLAAAAGLSVRYQLGEPWWWTTAAGAPCLYDPAARIALGGAPVAIPTVFAPLSPAQTALLDAAGVLLARATRRVGDAVRAVAPDAELLLLVYLPTVLDPRAPELARANLPPGWAAPGFDTLQLEDYDWVVAGDRVACDRGAAAACARLGYPIGRTHYFSGFVLRAPDAAAQWPPIEAAVDAARARGVAETFVWALPQVARDGLVHFEPGEGAMQAFDDVSFPLALGREASAEPGFSTAIVTAASGAEQRNADWAQGRLKFDAGPGVRSAADIGALVAFFRARRGAARGFRFRDPFDDSSAGMTDPCGFADVTLGTGDGTTTAFPLCKRYGEGDEAEVRRITRPIAGTVRVGVAGAERLSGWTLGAGGVVAFATAPAAGAAVTAGFRFEVPVRFAEDQLSVSLAAVQAGDAPSVPLVEIREAVA